MFKLEIKDVYNGSIEVVDNKEVYNLDDGDEIPGWLGGNARNYEWEPTLKFSSGVNISLSGREGKIAKGAIGTFSHMGSTVEYNQTMVMLMSGRFSHDGTKTTQIFPENLMQTCMLFSARKLVQADWVNQKDGYLKPNEGHKSFSNYSYESLVYSIFNTSSLQNSIEKNGLRVKNEFFFMPKEKIQSLANAHSNQKCYSDARHAEDRFVYKVINTVENGDNDAEFSDEAQLVLNLARELVEASFKYRMEFDKVKPEYQINNWDCGWYQVKGLLNWICENQKDDSIAEKYHEFKQAYSALGDKMRPMVYELGFLRK